jgi:DNA-binding NarL/FixJ family response regulator
MRGLAGREAELARLEEVADRCAGGQPGFVVVSGEPGIGKTSLLAELARRADARGFLVLEGRAAEFERGLPFAVVIDAFDEYLAGLDPHTRQRLTGGWTGELAAIFPSLRSLLPQTHAATGATERFRAHHALRELIERLSHKQPVLLALDDLHWADAASQELVFHLLRRPLAGRALVLGALRQGQAPAGLATVIAAGEREGRIVQLALGPLDRQDAGALLESVDPARRDQVFRASGGNPFYLEQLVRAGDAGVAGGAAPDGLPAAVTAAIRAELDAVPEPARRLVEAASVAGDPFDIDLATEVAAMPMEDALVALDDVVGHGLVRVADAPRRFRFRHPLMQAAVYAAIAPGSRLVAHMRAAKAMATLGAPAAARAHHVEAAARPGDAEAIALLREAGDESSSSAPETAARWYAAALRLSGADPSPRLELLNALGDSLAAAGRLPESRDAMLEALELVPAEAAAERAALVERCATVEILTGNVAAARGRLTEAVAAAPGPEQRASARVALAIVEYYSADFEDMLATALRAREPGLGAAMEAAVSGAVVLAYGAVGRIAEAREELSRAAGLVDELPDAALVARLDAPLDVGSAEMYLDLPDQAVARLRRGIEVSRRMSRGQFLPLLMALCACAEDARGKLADAAALAADAEEGARMVGDPLGLAWALYVQSRLALAAGDAQRALAAGEEGLELAEVATMRVWLGTALAAALLEIGRTAPARDLLLDVGGGAELRNVQAWRHAELYELLTRAALALGDVEGATGWAARAAAGVALPLSECRARRAEAMVLAARGEHAGVVDAALAAADRAGAATAPIEEARALLLAGRSQAELGRSTDALPLLERAEDVFAATGAELLRRRATSELRRLGRRRQPRSRDGAPDGGLAVLSDREREIAHLVRARRTNPEIAAELFLSVKTVETHLRNIFRKLEASSRIEVAQAVEREERRRG